MRGGWRTFNRDWIGVLLILSGAQTSREPLFITFPLLNLIIFPFCLKFPIFTIVCPNLLDLKKHGRGMNLALMLSNLVGLKEFMALLFFASKKESVISRKGLCFSNKHHFKNIQIGILFIRKLVEGLQMGEQTSKILSKEACLQFEMDKLLKREELLWRQKAKQFWLMDGDTNTRFFHLTTICHRKYNYIYSILSDNGCECTSWQDIGNQFESFFKSFFYILKA